jgi:hypothetical protein
VILGNQTARGNSTLLARVLRKGDSTWALRDDAGRPAWRMGGMRP